MIVGQFMTTHELGMMTIPNESVLKWHCSAHFLPSSSAIIEPVNGKSGTTGHSTSTVEVTPDMNTLIGEAKLPYL